MVAASSDVKVYTVNGAVAGSSSSIPDWLTRKRASTKAGKSKRAAREHIEGSIELIQGFEFPEASNRIKTTRDGHHAIATGTYKPQMRVWDLDELSLKFERHADAENVDFIILSDDWTKTIHLQNDRTIELHTQGGFHYRTRIPRFGRSLAYHFPSCDALFSASGNEIYRLNLEQGRFLNPLVLQDDEDDNILGVNCIDINPAHHLLAFGVDGNGTVQFWDPRSRSSVGILRLPRNRLLQTTGRAAASSLPGVDDTAAFAETLSVTAIASRTDGLSYAVGTSTGHTLLYDIRSTRPFALKDQGYGLPVRNVAWIEGGSRMAGDGMVLSADKKVVKIWDRDSPSSNFVSITPANDLNHIHHVPGSGLLLAANEGIQMATFYIPQLGPAPRWASFLENITEEMEDQTVRTVYEDYKFVERSELRTLGLDHLVGTPALKPYMHGYFVSLQLYDTARVIANPFAYAEHREKLVKDRMEKLAETRIRAKKEVGVKVNKALAEKIEKEAERERKREERKKARKARAEAEGGEVEEEKMEVDEEEEEENGTGEGEGKLTLLNDPRFKQLFENPEFAVDETSREYALMNPSAVAQKRNAPEGGKGRTKTAVEEEEDESDKASSDGLGESDSESEDGDNSDDSSDAGELNKFDPRVRPGQKNTRVQQAYSRTREQNRVANVSMVPLVAQTDAAGPSRLGDKNASFGQRRASRDAPAGSTSGKRGFRSSEGGMEMSWVPSSSSNADPGSASGKPKKKESRKGVEVFGAGMERGGEDNARELSESERKGRTQRRKGMRSGSKNVFRKMG
ncbi:WD40 repeat-like protein [Leucogyrophana mollusca]|uniref:WD40 repeat-like protein n=1 Tax=Leucogyrophana mollusca TaxID=85980 RepID=A0ACB8BN13_9AGAM|nr:WD40 repeat-like protein [Leucogyrophana mollusca]